MQIQVIGAGSWGLALTRLLARHGHEVALCARAEDGPDTLRTTRRSPLYLTGMHLPERVTVQCDEVWPAPEVVVFAVPSHVMRAATAHYRFPESTIAVSVAKGIENETLLRMSEVIALTHRGPVAALSGPSHAEEVGQDLPASLVAASADADAVATVQAAFNGPTLRVYTSPDVIGVELGGALKNVIAIAAGVSDGLALGDNARAALITRGLAEISRLGVALGADPLTFAGLSGMGDLIVTCDSRHSRNRRTGEAIARGETLDEILAGTAMVAEGVKTATSVHALAQREGIEMPICEQVYRVLFEGLDPRAAIATLMGREAKPERD